MNFLQYLFTLSAITSLLIMGPNMFPMQTFAEADEGKDDNKGTNDYKNSIQKDVDAKSEKTDQHFGQDNLCYSDSDCGDANEGEQVDGKDNEAAGFNDQSINIQQQQQQPTESTIQLSQTPGNETVTTPPPTLTPETCEECFATAFGGLSQAQILVIIDVLAGTDTITIESLCDFGIFSESVLTAAFSSQGVTQEKITSLINCLKAAGITIDP
jgi:hypothetical protein